LNKILRLKLNLNTQQQVGPVTNISLDVWPGTTNSLAWLAGSGCNTLGGRKTG
jgi:hypothetical protein